MKVFCNECKAYMVKVRTGLLVRDGYAVRKGDLYTCEFCGNDVISDFGEPFDYAQLPGDVQEQIIPEIQK